jgi:sec-independent protein translocase protein TatA
VIINFIYPLFLSDVSGSEVLLIFLFILIFFGSKSIPTMARTLGRTMREIRNASADFQNEIKKSGLDVKNDLNLSSIIKKTEEEIDQPLDQIMVDIKETVHYGQVNLDQAAHNLNETIPSKEIVENENNVEEEQKPVILKSESTVNSKNPNTELNGESGNNNG